MSNHSIPDIVDRQLLAPRGAEPVRRMLGGLSGAQVWQCASPLGNFCLRRWPATYPATSDLSRIHAAMHMAFDHGLKFVPRLHAASDGNSYVRDGKQLWELTQWMPGNADYRAQPTDEKLRGAMRALAQLHIAWSPTRVLGPSPAIASRVKRLEAWLTAESHTPPRVRPSATTQELALADQTHFELHQRGPDLLRELRQAAFQPTALQIVLRDIWCDHVLFSGQQVTGIIDFGATRLDEPATDVARLLGSLEPASKSRRVQGVKNYCQASSAPELTQVDFKRVDLLDRSGTLLAAAQWMQWLLYERREFDVPRSVLVERWASFLQRLAANRA